MPLLLGGGAVVVVVILFFAFGRGGDKPAQAGSNANSAASAPQKPAAAPPAAPVQLAGAKAGKPPTTPPPVLTQTTLQQLHDLLERAKDLRNEATKAGTGSGDVATRRAKMSEAKVVLEQWKGLCEPSLRWQEDAQMEGWAQPAEYVTLETLYEKYGKLEKEVRMGGGS